MVNVLLCSDLCYEILVFCNIDTLCIIKRTNKLLQKYSNKLGLYQYINTSPNLHYIADYIKYYKYMHHGKFRNVKPLIFNSQPIEPISCICVDDKLFVISEKRYTYKIETSIMFREHGQQCYKKIKSNASGTLKLTNELLFYINRKNNYLNSMNINTMKVSDFNLCIGGYEKYYIIDNKIVYLLSDDIFIYDLETNKNITSYKCHSDFYEYYNGFDFYAQQDIIIYSKTNKLTTFDTRDKKIKLKYIFPTSTPIKFIKQNKMSKLIFEENDHLYFYDFAANNIKKIDTIIGTGNYNMEGYEDYLMIIEKDYYNDEPFFSLNMHCISTGKWNEYLSLFNDDCVFDFGDQLSILQTFTDGTSTRNMLYSTKFY